MEIWKDLERSKYFMLDENTGTKSVCDKYGLSPTLFTPYASGFPKNLTARAKSPDRNYRVQPKKFDGYFQCPRPALEIQNKTRVRLKDDISSLPRPVKTLFFSKIYDKNTEKPSIKIPKTVSKPLLTPKTYTIEELKQLLSQNTGKDIKTAVQLEEMLRENSKTFRTTERREKTPEKRKLKGYFMTSIPSSAELFHKEKKIFQITNPVSEFKKKKLEELDRKYLEKRRAQKLLKYKFFKE
jgi:hypothetical protein